MPPRSFKIALLGVKQLFAKTMMLSFVTWLDFLQGPGTSRLMLLEDALFHIGKHAVGLIRWPAGAFNPYVDKYDSLGYIRRSLST